MTNEELASEIQKGHDEYLRTLWYKVERFVRKQASNYMRSLEDNAGIEFDDLYDSGYLALPYAVKQFNAQKGYTFLTYYGLVLKGQFNITVGNRTTKSRNDPLRKAISLHTPIAEDEEATIEEIIADDDVDVEEEVVNRIYIEELHDALEDALGKIDHYEEMILRLKYYSDMTVEQISDVTGFSYYDVRKLLQSGIRSLRKPQIRNQLKPFIHPHTNFYLHVSARSAQSPVEILVLERENIKHKLHDFEGP